MITINKGVEPTEWTERNATPNVVYEAIPELREALLIEQGYICAYCMRRIPATDINVDTTSKIEHILSREEQPDLQLSYANMAICCPGNLNNEAHCDKLKGGNSVSFNFHPNALQASIKYSTKSGKIISTNQNWDREINELLNLNHRLLMQNREQAIEGIVSIINSKGWSNAALRRKLNEWNTSDVSGKLKPYCGIVIWYLQKKLNQL